MAKLWVGAVDCSFNNCGWAFIEYNTGNKQTTIKTTGIIDNSERIIPKERSIDDLLRSQRLFENIKTDVIDLYTSLTNKKAFALEMPGGSQSSRAASCLGMARGVLGSVISEVANAQVIKHCFVMVKPTEVHKKATGSNKATKDQMMDYVCEKYKSQITVVKGKSRTVFTVENNNVSTVFNKGDFEHVADAIVIAELGLERLLKS